MMLRLFGLFLPDINQKWYTPDFRTKSKAYLIVVRSRKIRKWLGFHNAVGKHLVENNNSSFKPYQTFKIKGNSLRLFRKHSLKVLFCCCSSWEPLRHNYPALHNHCFKQINAYR